MFGKVLVANRGEIACRILQACRELKIRTVAIYSEVDADALHVQMADEAVCVGPATNADSYLNSANIISAAVITGADAIHPGYGNLSEDPNFAEACQATGIVFIGPPADDLGYPVMVKAARGGGGRGLRIIHNPEQLSAALEQAGSEARNAFGNGELYIERYMENARHLEVQILADDHGNVVHLGERDCSIQHRHQKLLEESPCVAVSRSTRRKLGEAAIRVAEAVGYRSAGTVEFLLDSKGRFYFIEMNTRIQVEHPVTEMLTGVDIVKEQLRIAAGERLGCEQGQIWFNGHAIECRIMAADGDRDFAPSPGRIQQWNFPSGPGVRIDSGVTSGSEVSSYYDPMIAKVVCWGQDRSDAISRMEATLSAAQVTGIRTTIPYHLRILGNAYFRRGEVDISFVEQRMD